MDVLFSFETLITFYQNTRHYIPQDSNFYTHCFESRMSHLSFLSYGTHVNT
jgi:hypothetical protein